MDASGGGTTPKIRPPPHRMFWVVVGGGCHKKTAPTPKRGGGASKTPRGPPFGESGRGFGRITASEVFRAEVLVASTITQHVIDGCQDRRGNRDRCLLGTVARFETEELGLEIAVLLARCAPRSLHQYGLEPGCS